MKRYNVQFEAEVNDRKFVDETDIEVHEDEYFLDVIYDIAEKFQDYINKTICENVHIISIKEVYE